LRVDGRQIRPEDDAVREAARTGGDEFRVEVEHGQGLPPVRNARGDSFVGVFSRPDSCADPVRSVEERP
jgi:hypothetical protein